CAVRLVQCGDVSPSPPPQPPHLRRKGARRAPPPQDIDGAVLGRCHEPRRRVLGHTSELPHFQRPAEGVLYNVLCQCQVVDPEDAHQRGYHAPRFAPEELIAEFHYVLNFMTGRTSTAPSTSKIGQPFEISPACTKSR